MKTRWLGAVIAIYFIFFAPLSAAAQAAFSDPIVPENCRGAGAAANCGICDIAALAQNLMNAGIYFAIFFSAVLFAWAGFKMVTAAGNSEQFREGRSIFTSVAIGLIIILVGWLAVDTLMKTVTNGSFGPWNKVCNVAMVSHFEKFYA